MRSYLCKCLFIYAVVISFGSFSFIYANPSESKIISSVSQQDSLALVVFYNNTNGSNWTNNSNWLTTQPVSTWYGITVENGRVTEIDLFHNRVIGIIPSDIGNLTNLKKLHLGSYGYNKLSGLIPPEVGNLTNLEYLYLFNNDFSGSIPPEIGNLINLEIFYMWNSNISGSLPPEMGNLTNLKRLHLSYNDLSGSIPPEIGNITNFRTHDIR